MPSGVSLSLRNPWNLAQLCLPVALPNCSEFLPRLGVNQLGVCSYIFIWHLVFHCPYPGGIPNMTKFQRLPAKNLQSQDRFCTTGLSFQLGHFTSSDIGPVIPELMPIALTTESEHKLIPIEHSKEHLSWSAWTVRLSLSRETGDGTECRRLDPIGEYWGMSRRRGGLNGPCSVWRETIGLYGTLLWNFK